MAARLSFCCKSSHFGSMNLKTSPLQPVHYTELFTWVALTGILLFAAFMHLHLLNTYPPGLDPDSAQDGIDALKPIRHNLWPFYIVINSNPDPIYIYTASLTTFLFGPSVLAMRFASAIYGLLGFAATYLCLNELGRDSLDPPARRLTAVLAVAVLAASQPIALIDRMGLRFITLLPFQMLSIWALVRAARTRHGSHWLLAGTFAGLTQYTYPSARVLPLLWGCILALKFVQERAQPRSYIKGITLFGLAVGVTLLPQLVWYAHYPNTFLARAGQTSFTQNPVYASEGLSGVLRFKADHYWQAISSQWLGQYNQIKEPLFAQVFFYALGIGALAVIFQRRRWFAVYVLCGLLVMLLPDLISGDRDWPHELRLIGAYPFLAAIAGFGLVSVWAATRRWPAVHRLTNPTLCILVGLTMIFEAREFFSLDLNQGKLFWSGNVWLRRIDYGVANHVNASNESFLIPLANYSDTVVKYLTSRRAARARSALDSSGQWVPISTNNLTLLLPNADDNTPWSGEPTAPWVLFSGNTAFILPPLSEMETWLPPPTSYNQLFDRGPFDFVELGRFHLFDNRTLSVAEPVTPDYSLNLCFEPGMCLIGASYDDWHLQAGGSLRVNVFWQVRHPIKDDYILFVHLLDREGNAIAGKDEYPLSHGYSTYEWGTDETIVTQTVIQLPADLAFGPYAIEAGFYLPYDASRVVAVDGTGNPIGDRAYFQHLKVARPSIQMPDDAAPTQITFGDELLLIGYRVDSLPVNGQPLRLTLWWQGLKPASQNWTEFFHLTPAADSLTLLGQADRALTGGADPPTLWDEGELVEEQIEIGANEINAGRYAVWMGLYSPATLERMVITASPTTVQENRTLLLEFEVK